jgi:hypothetical protein
MGINITPQPQIKAYFESPRLGQSTLKGLLKGFDSFLSNQDKDEKELHYEEKEHFIIGSAVDCILTGEAGEFKKQYYTSQLDKKPSDVEMSMTQQVYDELAGNGIFEKSENTIELKDCEDMIKIAIENHDWQRNWKMETKVAKIIDACSNYFNDLKASYGKQILSSEQNAKIHNIVNSLRLNRRTKRFFDRESQAAMGTNIEFYYQLPIYFEYEGIDCKALLDLVVVVRNEEGNIVEIFPYDLKTMAGTTKYFLSSLKARRYDIQAVWYTNALMSHFNVTREVVKQFSFIVESSTNPGKPLIFVVNDQLYKIGQQGRPAVKLIDTNFFHPEMTADINIQHEIMGINQLIADYKFYEEQGWQEDKEIAERDGIMEITWEGLTPCN